ncbi:unnamed protein product, partial [Porites lobata]
LIAFAQSLGSSDSTTQLEPCGTFLKASPNPEFPLTSTGRPADKASRAARPKPSVRDGITARSTSQNNSASFSLLSLKQRTLTLG